MRRLFLILALLVSSLAWAGTCGSGYTFSIALTLHKGSGSDQTNFAAPISVRDIRLATVANGGNVQNTVSNSLSRTVPADLVFCPDQTLTSTPLKYETESYGATYGDYVGWVQIPTLHFGSYDTIYLFTNNSAVTTDQEDLTMWSDLSYAAVWHYPNGSTIDLKDSSGNANDITAQGTLTAFLSGGFDGASSSYSFSNYGKVASSSTFKHTSNITWESWDRATGTSNYNTMLALDYRSNGSWSVPYCVCLKFYGNGSRIYWHLVSGGVEKDLISAGSLKSTFTPSWQFVAASYDGATSKIFIDGAQDANTLSWAGTIDYGTSLNLAVGIRSQYTPDEVWTGQLDEQRIRNVASSSDYIATQGALNPYTSTFQFGAQTATSPVKQFITCGSPTAAGSCVLPFTVTATGVLVAMVNTIDSDCSAMSIPNDSAGNVYTFQIGSNYTGTLHHYYNCIFTAPITGTGADTVTSPSFGGDVSMTVYEVKGVTVSGLQTTQTTNTTPPATMTLTSGQANTFLICGTREGTSVSQPSYVIYNGNPSSSNDHAASNTVAYAVTGSGAQSCSFTSGVGGVMAMFAPAPAGNAVRHRVTYQ
jgi:hypothetical protein